MNKLAIGIDTSNYTTSLALVRDGVVIKNVRRLLPVAEKERGLRQSDALFYHTKALPELFKGLFADEYTPSDVACVGVSSTPREEPGSYMPCFLAGVSVATAISSSLCVPLYQFSHQQGHVTAALYSSDIPDGCNYSGDFISFHVSGGTTDIIMCSRKSKEVSCKRIGGTNDLNAGQAIDRAGVLMGMRFPCGKELDALSLQSATDFGKIKVSVKNLECSLSGLENKTKNLLDKNVPTCDIAAFIFEYLGTVLGKLCDNIRETYPDLPIVFAGGVMSNTRIRKSLSMRENVFFASPELSSDNACGTALLAYHKHRKD